MESRREGEEPTSKDFLLELERERLRSLVEPDVELMHRLHADDYELIPPHGIPMSGETYLGAIQSGAFIYDVFEAASEPRVRIYRDAAVLRYQARIEAHGQGWRDEGMFWHTDVYEQRDGQWQAVWSQATRISPDFGS
jgi:hypothetical protein